MKTFKTPVLITSIFLFFSSTQSQLLINTGFHNAFDDNVNNNYLNTFDKLIQLTLQVGYDFESENRNVQLFYLGGLNYYQNIISRSFHTHSTGFVYSKIFGEESETTLNFGGNYNIRVGREDYTYFNNSQYIGYINLKHQLTARTFGRLGYRLRYLNYEELSDLNNLENYIFAQTMSFLPSRTTLALEANLGIKTYTNAPPETTSISFGMGKGKSTITESYPSVIQVGGNIRVAQSVFERTGLSVALGYQKNLQQETRYLPSGYILSDDNLFDDNYGYEGPSLEATLTQVLPLTIIGKITFNYINKNYVNRPAYNLLDSIKASERVDKVTSISILIEKELSWLNGITISLMYDFIRNASNDEYYDYKNNVFAISFEIGF